MSHYTSSGFSMDDGKSMLNNLLFNLGLIKDHNSVSISKPELHGGIFFAAYPKHKSGMFCVGDGSNILSFNGTHIAGLRNVMRSLEKNKVHHAIVEHHLFLDQCGKFICMKRLGDKSRFRKVLVSRVDMEGEVIAFFGKDTLARCLYAEGRINKDAVIDSERSFYEHSQLIEPATEFNYFCLFDFRGKACLIASF